MNSTDKQLETVFQEISDSFADNPEITVTPGEGSPPAQYTVTYHITGACREADGEVTSCDEHTVSLSLPFNFPNFPPNCIPESSTFHPDFDPSAICIDDAWETDKSIVQLILHMGRMISGEIFSEVNAFNEEAAEWYKANRDSLPFGSAKKDEEKGEEVTLSLESADDGTEEIEELTIDTLDDEAFGQPLSAEEGPSAGSEEIDPDFLTMLAKQKRFHTISQELEKCGDRFDGRADLEEQTELALNQATVLFNEAFNLDRKGKHREALGKLDLVEQLVTDSPNLQEERTRIQQAFDLLGDWVNKEEDDDETILDDFAADDGGAAGQGGADQADTTPEELTFYNEEREKVRSKSLKVIGATVALALLGTLVFSYFFLGSSMKKAERRYAECEKLLKANDFNGAEQKCRQALELVGEVQVVKQGEKTELEKQIRSLLDSPKLLQGLEGKTLVKGRYVSQATKELLLAFEEAVKNGDSFFSQERWQEAEQTYKKALVIGTKAGTEEGVLTELRGKQDRAHYNRAVAQAKNAMATSSWQTAQKLFNDAIELAKGNPQVQEEEIAELKRNSRQAEFNSLRSKGHGLFKESKWSEALESYQGALNLASELDLEDGDTISSLNENIARTKIYLAIAKGKEAFAASQWDTVISQYEKAIILLEENSTLLKEINTEESGEKLARIMLHAAIIRDKQEVARHLKGDEYKPAIKQLQKIKETITSSRFAQHQEFKTILGEISSQIGDIRKQQLVLELATHLTDNYEKLFLKHYPAAVRSILSDPKAEYLKDVGRRMLFRMQCTETAGGRPLRLQMDYIYSPANKSWQFYSEKE